MDLTTLLRHVCYLYRKTIPIFTQQGFRVIAPDFIGFGKSKLMQRSCPQLSNDEAYAYDAPFPGQEYKASLGESIQILMCSLFI